jgi:hypothetical protein
MESVAIISQHISRGPEQLLVPTILNAQNRLQEAIFSSKNKTKLAICRQF